MGISFSIPCDPCINKAFHWLDEKVGYTNNLKKNLLALEKAMEKLKAKRDDLSRRVAREEDRGQQGLAEIKVWLSQVMTIENRVNDLFADRDVQLQKLCLCGFCSKSLISSYRYGKNVFLTLRVENLEHLQVLTFEIHHFVLEEYWSSQKLTSSTISLKISNINMKSSGIVLPETMQKLWRFFIVRSSISEIKMISPLHSLKNLSEVRIDSCEGLKEMTLLMFASNLKYIFVKSAHQLEDIINIEKACESEESGIVPFPKLVKLVLLDLPKLKSIYWSPLPLSCLKEIWVAKCPNLKKLPLDSQSCMHGENGLVIRYGKKKWIEGVEWQDEATKTRFLSSCKQI